MKLNIFLWAILGLAIVTFKHTSADQSQATEPYYDCGGQQPNRQMPFLKKKLKLIKLDCGQVCDTDIKPLRKSKYYDYIEKNVDCLNLFESPVLEQTVMEPVENIENYQPPNFCELPDELKAVFTHHGKIKVCTLIIQILE